MRPVLASVLLFLTYGVASAQNFGKHGFHHATHTNNSKTAKTTIADPAEDNYDVKYVKFDLAMTNTSKAISGNVTTKAMVASASLPAYVFELDTLFTIDSVLINGVSRPFTTSAPTIRSCALTTPLPSGTLFTTQVFYHGTSAQSSSYPPDGINYSFDNTWHVNTTFTHSEAYTANKWWPCKQSLRDKIDSVDIWITVPDSLKAGSNGRLDKVTTIDATHDRYEWKERYPIDYYLISIATGPYTDYSYYMHFSGCTDSMKIQNYVFPGMLSDPAYKTVLDSIGIITDYFSSLFGRYPFWQEKYGHSIVVGGAGMEHQTMTTVGTFSFDMSTVVHELSHQWWGDNVTCGTWRDLTMNEGMATYCEVLFKDSFHSHAGALSYMQSIQNNVKSYDTGAVYTPDTSYERIFDGRLTYYKGACIVHMLRSVINNDNNFFNLMKVYQQQQQYGSGTITDFKNTAISLYGNVVNGIDLDTFLNQWFFLEGFPEYNVKWEQSGSDVYIRLAQNTSAPSSVPLFTLPVDLQLLGPGGNDTTIRVINDQPVQTFHFTWNKTMTTMRMDPEHWLLYRLGVVVRDTSILSVDEIVTTPASIFPNPATTNWTVSHLPVNSALTLTDIYGRTLWQINNANATLNISADQLATGMYILRVLPKDGAGATYKLIKQ